MFVRRALLFMGLLFFFHSTARAGADTQGQLGGLLGPKVYNTSGCNPDCHVTATAEAWPWPDPPVYTVLASLDLPAGDYLLFAKLSTYPETPSSYPAVYWGGLECVAGLADLSQGDWTTTGYSEDQNVSVNMVPIKLTARITRVILGCRLNGAWFWESEGYDTRQPVKVGIWGARLMAMRVGIVIQK